MMAVFWVYQTTRRYNPEDSHLVPTAVRTSNPTFVYISVAQPFYTRGTLNIVEESWRHTNPILHIVEGRGEMVYGIDWPRQLLINRPQSKNVLFDVHNYPSLLLRHLF
jgi:hypothetical protein